MVISYHPERHVSGCLKLTLLELEQMLVETKGTKRQADRLARRAKVEMELEAAEEKAKGLEAAAKKKDEVGVG